MTLWVPDDKNVRDASWGGGMRHQTLLKTFLACGVKKDTYGSDLTRGAEGCVHAAFWSARWLREHLGRVAFKKYFRCEEVTH